MARGPGSVLGGNQFRIDLLSSQDGRQILASSLLYPLFLTEFLSLGLWGIKDANCQLAICGPRGVVGPFFPALSSLYVTSGTIQ